MEYKLYRTQNGWVLMPEGLNILGSYSFETTGSLCKFLDTDNKVKRDPGVRKITGGG